MKLNKKYNSINILFIMPPSKFQIKPVNALVAKDVLDLYE